MNGKSERVENVAEKKNWWKIWSQRSVVEKKTQVLAYIIIQ